MSGEEVISLPEDYRLLETGYRLMFLGNQYHRWRNARKEYRRALIVLNVPERLLRLQFAIKA